MKTQGLILILTLLTSLISCQEQSTPSGTSNNISTDTSGEETPPPIYQPTTNVVIPNSVTSIEDYELSEKDLTSVMIPNSVTSIGIWAFYGNLLTSVVIPNSVTSIGLGAFSTNQLKSVEIPNSVTSIADKAFMLNQLKSVVIPNSVRRIGVNAFFENKLTRVVIPAGISIEDYYSMGTYGGEFNTLYTNPTSGGAGTYNYVQGTGWMKQP